MATIRKRKSGTYEIKVSCGYDINGKQIIQYKHWKPEDGMTKKANRKGGKQTGCSLRGGV